MESRRSGLVPGVLVIGALVGLAAFGASIAGAIAGGARQRPPAPRAARGVQPRPTPARAEANWVVVAPNKRYLIFEDGTPFVPMGFATSGDLINLDYFGATTIGGRALRFGSDHFDRLFADMKAHGENFLRIDVEGTGHMPRPDTVRLIREGKIGFVESPVGTFSEEYARRLDRLIALADKYDVYLGLVLIAHTCDLTRPQTGLFDLYPYSAAQGGPLRNMDDLFTSPAARRAWQQRMTYVSDRWGRSRRVAMWELYNELLNCGGTKPAAAGAWVEEMGGALREHERARYGKAHPVVVSTVSFVPVQRFFYDSQGTDLAVSHLYTDEADSGNPVEVAKAIHDGVRKNLAAVDYARPFIENERTLSRRYPDAVQAKMEHAAAWALVASGAASPGATWVVLGEATPFRDRGVVAPTHRAMRPILDTIPFASFDSRPVEIASSNPEVLPMAVSDGAGVLGWLLHDNADDYDIENIRAWRQNRGADEVLASQAIGNWVRIVDEQGASRRLDAHFEKLAGVIALRTGLSRQEAMQRAKEILRTPRKAGRFLQRIAKQRGREFVMQKVRESLAEVTATLEDIERQQGILRRRYRGHPQVTSELTLTGLRAGRHRVVWYDDATGRVIREDAVDGPRPVLRTPPFSEHVAFTVLPVGAARPRARP